MKLSIDSSSRRKLKNTLRDLFSAHNYFSLFCKKAEILLEFRLFFSKDSLLFGYLFIFIVKQHTII